MKKSISILLLLIICVSAYSQKQKKGNFIDDIGLGYNSQFVDSIAMKKSISQKIYLSGAYMQQSASFQFYSLGLSALSGGAFYLGSRTHNNKSNRQACFIMGSLFGAGAVTCYIASVCYKLKSGKTLKLSVAQNGGKLSYNF